MTFANRNSDLPDQD
jgi:hypothetical protein